eukprot:g867.t1
MGGGHYDVMLQLALFIAAQWMAGRCFRRVGAPPILAQMIAGVLLGPEVADIVPYAKTCGAQDTSCTPGDPSILVLVGNIGVALMIFESGMHLHFDKVKEVGREAFVVAIIGTLAPVILGVLLSMAIGLDPMPEGISIGIALAPTSVGIALKMLGDAKFLNSTQGQTIITAAFVDDIFSLVMLAILTNISAGDVTAGSLILTLVLCFGFVALGVALALYVMPQVKVLVNRVGESKTASLQPRDEVHLMLMVCTVIFFGWIGSLPQIGSHLLGTFVAGVTFTNVPRSGLVWGRQIKRIVSWMMRFFFSASIAFSIPVSVMFTADAFWKGLVLASVPCIGGKLLSGIFSGQAIWMVGWAMVARGEFAYLVAQTAKELDCKSCDPIPDPNAAAGVNATLVQPKMLSQKSYSALVWALLWSTITAPVMFKRVLNLFVKARGDLQRSTSIGGSLASQRGQRFVMRLVGMHHTGVLHEVMDVLHACELDVLEAHAESDDLIDVDRFVIVPRGKGDLDDEKLHEIASRVKEAVNDDESQVVFEPINFDEDLESTGVLQIRMIGDHHPDILHEIFDVLADAELDVMRAVIDEHAVMGEHGAHTDGGKIKREGEEGKTARRRISSLTHKRGGGDDDESRRSRILSWSHSNRRLTSDGKDKGERKSPAPGADGSDSGADSDKDRADSDKESGSGGEGRPSSSKRRSRHGSTESMGGRARTDSILKETETIYAHHSINPATGKRKPITATERSTLRSKINALIQSHNCHGECMLRMVRESEAHEVVHPITAIALDDEVSVVTTHGRHHPDIIHEVLDELAALRLDVLHADIVQPDSALLEDKSVFYVRNVDADAEVEATDRDRRHEVRERLTAVYAKHGIDGHASVRPLNRDRAPVISARLSVDDFMDDDLEVGGSRNPSRNPSQSDMPGPNSLASSDRGRGAGGGSDLAPPSRRRSTTQELMQRIQHAQKSPKRQPAVADEQLPKMLSIVEKPVVVTELENQLEVVAAVQAQNEAPAPALNSVLGAAIKSAHEDSKA